MDSNDAPLLSPHELELLDFERDWWRHAGQKATAIKQRFRIGPSAYYRELTALLDDDRALEYDPMLVKRLRRMRRRRAG